MRRTVLAIPVVGMLLTLGGVESLCAMQRDSRSEETIRALTGALQSDTDAEVRRASARALGEIEDVRAVSALGRALEDDEDSRVRVSAAWALGEIEHRSAAAGLATALRDDDPVVRRTAARALGRRN
jgi:HEAT repeat protein